MLAQVGRVRHQRRHSDVSLATAEPEHLALRHIGRQEAPPPVFDHTPSELLFLPQPPVRIDLRGCSALEVRGRSRWTGLSTT